MYNKLPRKPGRPLSSAAVDRSAVLRNAFYLFADQGYDKATMRALAAACGVSPALLTHMFQTKENLWYEAVDAIYGPIPDTAAGDNAPGGCHRRLQVPETVTTHPRP